MTLGRQEKGGGEGGRRGGGKPTDGNCVEGGISVEIERQMDQVDKERR